jgi:hypothetical protein
MLVSTYSIVNIGYNPSTIENDIAVVRLPSAVNFNGEYCHTETNMNIILLFTYSTDLSV